MISVIVTVYKIEDYLDECVQSIVDQTYRDLEIILVDDGSPDNCPAMCDAWAQKDARVRVIHKPNGGASDARNAALSVAIGEWIAFVDGDDWIAPDFYEILITAAEQEGADIANAGCYKCYGERQEFYGKTCDKRVFTPEQAFMLMQQGVTFHMIPCDKIFKGSLFDGIQFPVGKKIDDEFVIYRLVDRAEKLTLCQQAIYYYRQREGSAMASWDASYIDELEAFLARLRLFKEKYPRLYALDYGLFCTYCVMFYRKLLTIGADKAAFAKLKQYRRSAPSCFKQWWSMSNKHKVYVLCSKIHLGLFAKILNFRHQIDD